MTIRRSLNKIAVLLSGAMLVQILGISSVSAAQTVPYKINFQGRISTNTGAPVADGDYNVKFRLYDNGNSVVYSEDYIYAASDNRVTVQKGLFNVQIGSLGSLSPALFADASQLSIEMELPTPATATCATNGCAVFTEGPLSPRQPIASSASAMNADLLDGMDSTAFGDATAANQTTLLGRVGTTGDAASSSGSIFARLSDLFNHSGNNNDSASSTDTSSAHAKLNFLTNAFTASGATGDVTDSASGNIFQRLHDLYTRVSSVASTIGSTGDTGGSTSAGTVNAKLNAILGSAGGGGGSTFKSQLFTSTGTWTRPAGVDVVNVLVVGGGGGGGNAVSLGGGGGGGGGYAVLHTSVPVSGNVSVTVGSGGSSAGAGNPSSFGSYRALGGGAGGSSSDGQNAALGQGGGKYNSSYGNSGGGAGGSGGGGGGMYSTGTLGGYAGTMGDGGQYGGYNSGSNAYWSGGGAGSGGKGGGFWYDYVNSSTATQVWKGQMGTAFNISGVTQPYGGGGGSGYGTQGGGSGSGNTGVGGNGASNAGGGGASGNVNGGNATANTGGNGASAAANSGGGGGGGGVGSNTGGIGGSGGSGYVLVTWWE